MASPPRAYDAPSEVVALDVDVPEALPPPSPPLLIAAPTVPVLVDGNFPMGGSGRLMRYDRVPAGRGGALLGTGGVIAALGVIAGGLSLEGDIGAIMVTSAAVIAAPPFLVGGAVLRARAQAYEDVWLHPRAVRDVRVREAVSWSVFAATAGIATAASMSMFIWGRDGTLCGERCGAMPYLAWISGTVATAVALPGASHATAYRRRAQDLSILRGRAQRSGLGHVAFGTLGPPRRAGTGRIVAGATIVATAGIVLPVLLGSGGVKGGVLLPTLAVAAVLGGSGLALSGGLARHRANAWRAHTSRLSLSPSLSPRLMGLVLRGRV